MLSTPLTLSMIYFFGDSPLIFSNHLINIPIDILQVGIQKSVSLQPRTLPAEVSHRRLILNCSKVKHCPSQTWYYSIEPRGVYLAPNAVLMIRTAGPPSRRKFPTLKYFHNLPTTLRPRLEWGLGSHEYLAIQWVCSKVHYLGFWDVWTTKVGCYHVYGVWSLEFHRDCIDGLAQWLQVSASSQTALKSLHPISTATFIS